VTGWGSDWYGRSCSGAQEEIWPRKQSKDKPAIERIDIAAEEMCQLLERAREALPEGVRRLAAQKKESLPKGNYRVM
jgi:hypothetical protein